MGKLNVWLIIFLDNILLMAVLAEDLTLAQDSLIYLFQNLGFLINMNNLCLNHVRPYSF